MIQDSNNICLLGDYFAAGPITPPGTSEAAGFPGSPRRRTSSWTSETSKYIIGSHTLDFGTGTHEFSTWYCNLLFTFLYREGYCLKLWFLPLISYGVVGHALRVERILCSVS